MVNGELGYQVSVVDRGLAYGDGLFETIRVTGGYPVLLEFHLQRLQDGLRKLSISVSLEVVRRQLQSLLELATKQNLHNGVIKLIVTRGVAGRGFSPGNDISANVVSSWLALPDFPQASYHDGIELIVCHAKLPHRPQLAGLKHLNCLDYVMASLELQGQPNCEGLLLDQGGLLVEAISANVFLVSGGELLTPSLHRCGVAGTMRRWVIEVAALEVGLSVAERDLPLDSFEQADEVFICNSVRGVTPVSRVQGRQWRRGSVTAAIQTEVMTLFNA
jgi:4-amino-4-deoxychorismate lyase